jgi:hypothetical protein
MCYVLSKSFDSLPYLILTDTYVRGDGHCHTTGEEIEA